MKRLVCSLCLLLAVVACQSQSHKDTAYPFTLQDVNGRFEIMAAIETKDLYPKYFNLFKRYGYSGNGESWSDIIQQILEKRAPDLIERITFDPEAGAFFAYAENEGDRQRFIQIVAPVFSDIKALESFIRNADKSRMDD